VKQSGNIPAPLTPAMAVHNQACERAFLLALSAAANTTPSAATATTTTGLCASHA